MIEDGRVRAIPYDPRLPVHTVWDLGWNDSMSIVMVQQPVPSVINVINYLEDSHRTYTEYVADLTALGYMWGDDWLPHDGIHKHPTSGQSAKQMLQGFGRRVRIIPRGDVEIGIRNARMLLPRIYIDDSTRKRPTGFLGGARLVECLKRYRRNVPTSTEEPARPVHDQYSHAADAIRGLATIADRLRNESGSPTAPALPAFQNAEPSMGVLG